MRIFLDTCDVKEIKKFNDIGLIDGVTTNPSIIAASGLEMRDVIYNICQVINTSVSAEVLSITFEEMILEAESYSKIAPQVTIKLPMTEAGFRACKELAKKGISVNMTLCFSPAQALLAAKVGAEYVSPFVGRVDDIGQSGINLVEDICTIYGNYPSIGTKIIVASVRNIAHFVSVAKSGADIATVSPKLLYQLMHHSLTEEGIKIFLNDWEKAGQIKK